MGGGGGSHRGWSLLFVLSCNIGGCFYVLSFCGVLYVNIFVSFGKHMFLSTKFCCK